MLELTGIRLGDGCMMLVAKCPRCGQKVVGKPIYGLGDLERGLMCFNSHESCPGQEAAVTLTEQEEDHGALAN